MWSICHLKFGTRSKHSRCTFSLPKGSLCQNSSWLGLVKEKRLPWNIVRVWNHDSFAMNIRIHWAFLILLNIDLFWLSIPLWYGTIKSGFTAAYLAGLLLSLVSLTFNLKRDTSCQYSSVSKCNPRNGILHKGNQEKSLSDDFWIRIWWTFFKNYNYRSHFCIKLSTKHTPTSLLLAWD